MTAALLARCRAALQASDETAKAIVHTEERVSYYGDELGYGYTCDCGHQESGYPTKLDAGLWSDNHVEFASTPADEKQLALNAALRTVLDGIEATLTEHYDMDGCCGYCSPCWAPTSAEVRYDARGVLSCRRWPCPDHSRATASLTAIASALGVQEADRG